MFIKRFFKFLKYFGKGYNLKLITVLFLSFTSSLLEFLSIVLMFPFIMILVNPSRVVDNPVAQYFNIHFNISGTSKMILLIGCLLAGIIIIKNIYSILIIYWQNKIISNWGLDIKEKMLKLYLYSPYEADLKNGKTNTMQTITTNVDGVMQYYIFKIISFISNTFVIILIFSILIFMLPLYTILAILFFSVAGTFQSSLFRKWADKLATEKYKLVQGPYDSVISSLSNIKDIKVNNCQNQFFNVFAKISRNLIPYNEKISLIPMMPQYIIEIIFIFTMIILCFGILQNYGENPSNILVSFGVVAIAIYRVVPQIYKNQIYINYISIYTKNIDELFRVYEEYLSYEYPKEDNKNRLPFENQLSIKNLFYSYDKVNNVLKNINVDIKKGEFIGVVGLSGSGKSTFVDCLLGLLNYQGEICIDNKVINSENIRSFRNIVGYVPQKINTIEGDIYKNVAWGVEDIEIDRDKVDEILKVAQLYDQLITAEQSLNILIKQDGTGLSGGQMQRIGIARALYRNPEIIILDEATSNLDVKVESKLAEVISSIKGEKTIIAIAHRLSTLIDCDRIIYLKDGELVDIGTFNELSTKHSDFEEILRLSRIKIEDKMDNI